MNILIPTDFSKNAKKALEYVYIHFKPETINVRLIHTIKEPHSTSGVLLRLDNLMKKDAELHMKEQLDEVKAKYNVVPEYSIKQGYLKDWVLQYGESYNIDLIVMGTKGESNVRSKIMGSVTESIIRSSKIPVLAIPEESSDLPMHHFVLATELRELKHKSFIQMFLEHLKLSAPHIDVLTIQTPESKGGLPKSIPFKEYQIGVKTLRAASAVDGINAYLDTHRVDILGIYHSKSTRLEYLFNKSITKVICAKTKVPLLVIPDF